MGLMALDKEEWQNRIHARCLHDTSKTAVPYFLCKSRGHLAPSNFHILYIQTFLSLTFVAKSKRLGD